MNKNITEKPANKKNKNILIAIIIGITLIIIAGAILLVYKDARAKNRPPDSPNVTLFKCSLGKVINDSDLEEIKELAVGVIGNKVLKVEKGAIRPEYNPLDENGEEFDFGDSVTITFSVLTTDEKMDIFNMLVDKYGITPAYLIDGLGNDIYRVDYK